MNALKCMVLSIFLLVTGQLSAQNDTANVSGTVVFPADFALPSDAVLLVSVQNVSMADAPSRLLAETKIVLKDRAGNQSYKIKVPKSSINPHVDYIVHATVRSMNRLLLNSTRRYSVLTRGAPNQMDVELEVVQTMSQTDVKKQHGARADLQNTYWKLVELAGGKVAMSSTQQREVYLILESSTQRIKGFGGCNSLSGRYQHTASSLMVQALSRTRMVCAPVEMALEVRFQKTLSEVTSYYIDQQVLTMTKGKKVLARYEAVYL